MDQAFADALWTTQIAAQNALAKRYPGARHITHTTSTHYIQTMRPRLVRAIRSNQADSTLSAGERVDGTTQPAGSGCTRLSRPPWY
jgi:hypothetical protein